MATRLKGARLAIFMTLACLLAAVAVLPVVAKEQLRALIFVNSPRPEPTGEFAVGRTTFSPVAGEGVDLWYPVERSSAGLVVRAGARLRSVLWPTEAAALDNAPPAGGSLRPLVLLLPSWFAERHQNTFMAANLASHGFVVAAVDDFVHGAPLSGADRTAQLGSLDMTSDEGFAASRLISRRRSVLGAEAAIVKVDQVIAHSTLGTRIDPQRIGIVGFSFGGSIAAAMSREKGRIRAVINLDGDVIETERWPPTVPYLFLTSDLPYPSAADLASPDLGFRYESVTTRDTYDLHMRPDVPQNCVALSVKGATHEDFSDRLVMPSFGDFWTARTNDRIQMWSDINRLIVSFLSANLGDGTTRPTLLDAPPARFAKLPSP